MRAASSRAPRRRTRPTAVVTSKVTSFMLATLYVEWRPGNAKRLSREKVILLFGKRSRSVSHGGAPDGGQGREPSLGKSSRTATSRPRVKSVLKEKVVFLLKEK